MSAEEVLVIDTFSIPEFEPDAEGEEDNEE